MGGQEPPRRVQRDQLATAVAPVVQERRSLSRGEVAFLIVVAVALIAAAIFGPGGVAFGLGIALAGGLMAGIAIAIKRRRRGSRGAETS